MAYITEVKLRVGIHKKKALAELDNRADMNVIQQTISKKETTFTKIFDKFNSLGLKSDYKTDDEMIEMQKIQETLDSA